MLSGISGISAEEKEKKGEKNHHQELYSIYTETIASLRAVTCSCKELSWYLSSHFNMQGCFMPKYSYLKPEQEQLPLQSCFALFQIPFHFPALHCFSWSQTVNLCFNQSASASVQQKMDSLCSKIVLKNQLKSEPPVIWSIHTHNLCWQKVQGEEEQGKEEESVQGSVHNAHSWK